MGGFRGERVLGVAVIVTASFYRPLVFWAANAWELMRPSKPILVGLAVSVFAVGIFWVALRLTHQVIPVSLGISLTILILYSWDWITAVSPLVLLLASAAIAFLTRFLSEGVSKGAAFMFIVLIGTGSIAQLVIAHVTNANPISLVERTQAETVEPTGKVEDVLVVIVDGYPSTLTARALFGHDQTKLLDRLNSLGYAVPIIGWSQHAHTLYSIPSILELQPVVIPGGSLDGVNKKALGEIVGGRNLVAEALRAAGYTYTHIESGWNEGTCHSADVCVAGPWIDETIWNLLRTSVVADWLSRKHGDWFVATTFNSYEELLVLRERFQDGSLDFVFAHLLLPHPPMLVDGGCALLSAEERSIRSNGSDATASAWSGQLSCVDQMIAEIAELAGESTAVLITADHGTKTLPRPNSLPTAWTQANIAESYGIFLAYRLPQGCDEPMRPMNTAVMASIMKCAISLDGPTNSGELLVGFEEPRWINQIEVSRIEDRLLRRELVLEGD